MSFNVSLKDKGNLLSSEESTFLVIFNSIQIIFGSTANAFEVVFFLSKRHCHNIASDRLILNLAVADFFALTTYLPWRTYLLHIRQTTKQYIYYTSLFVVCIFSTGNATLLIGVDRFISTIRPLRYHALVSGKAVCYGVLLGWFVAFLLGVGHGLSYPLKIHSEYELFLSFLSVGQLIVMSTMYVVVMKTARQQRQKILEQVQCIAPCQSVAETRTKLFYSWKSSYTTFCMVSLFYITFLPYSVYRMVSTFDDSISKTSKRITWRWLISFSFLHSCLNPFVYFIAMNRFRSKLKRFVNNNSNVV